MITRTNTRSLALVHSQDSIAPRFWTLEITRSLAQGQVKWEASAFGGFRTAENAIDMVRGNFGPNQYERFQLVSPDGLRYGFNKLGECTIEKHRSSFDFDHINTMWDSTDWESDDNFGLRPLDNGSEWNWDLREQDVFTPSLARSLDSTNTRSNATRYQPTSLARRHANALHSLLTRMNAFFGYKKVGGIHFIRIGNWSVSASRKRKTQVKRDIEERLLRLLAYLIIWPALCITVILLMEAIGFSGR